MIRRILIVLAMLVVAAILWRVLGVLSPDALGLAVGVLFGVLAGLPTAVLVLASSRNAELHRNRYIVLQPQIDDVDDLIDRCNRIEASYE